MRLGLFFNEGRRRKLSPLWSRIVGVLVVLFAAVELYGAPFGFIDSFILRSVFVSFAITLTFICYTPIRTEPGQSENVPVPDILLACFGCPKQEKWVSEHYRDCASGVTLCAGATVDFLAGNVKRAPKVFSENGLEWFYRFVKEPKRLFRRYFVDDMQIFCLAWKYRKEQQ